MTKAFFVFEDVAHLYKVRTIARVLQLGSLYDKKKNFLVPQKFFLTGNFSSLEKKKKISPQNFFSTKQINQPAYHSE